MEWLLGVMAGLTVFLLTAKDKPELLDKRLRKKTEISQKLQQMLHMRKGFEISKSVITFPFFEHPKMTGIAVDEKIRQICLIEGDFEEEAMNVKVVDFRDVAAADILVNGVKLIIPESAQQAHDASVRLAETDQLKEVVLNLHLNHRQHREHQVKFIEKSKGDGANALQTAKTWYFYLNDLTKVRT